MASAERRAGGIRDVLALSELPPGEQRVVELGSGHLLLCRDADTDTICAISNKCPHAYLPLEGGAVQDGVIQCPRHGARFDLLTGRPLNAVTTRPLAVFPVQVRDGRILVSGLPGDSDEIAGVDLLY